MARVTRAFLARGAEVVAPELLGCVLVRTLADGTRLSGRIVEAEAYLGAIDRAAHTFGGRRTARNESMYAKAGTCYVYFTYGMHHCMNVVCGREGEPVATLVRALEPLEGLDVMRAHRGSPGKRVRDVDLCSGPGKLCQALAIDRSLDGADLLTGPGLTLEEGEPPARGEVARGPRIGVANAGEWAKEALRWWIAGNPHVSAQAPGGGGKAKGT